MSSVIVGILLFLTIAGRIIYNSGKKFGKEYNQKETISNKISPIKSKEYSPSPYSPSSYPPKNTEIKKKQSDPSLNQNSFWDQIGKLYPQPKKVFDDGTLYNGTSRPSVLELKEQAKVSTNAFRDSEGCSIDEEGYYRSPRRRSSILDMIPESIYGSSPNTIYDSENGHQSVFSNAMSPHRILASAGLKAANKNTKSKYISMDSLDSTVKSSMRDTINSSMRDTIVTNKNIL
jgi:hypothetical protein